MPSIHALINESANILQLSGQTPPVSFPDQERLSQISPSFQPSSQAPSPPSHHVLDLPSLLECLNESPLRNRMPPPFIPVAPSSDSEDDFDALGFLGREAGSDIIDATSTICGESVAEEPESVRDVIKNEIDTELLREGSQLDEMDSDDFDDLDEHMEGSTSAYRLSDVIEEARAHYGDKIPDFCIKRPEKTVRKVSLIGSNDTAKIDFERWSDGYGYWTLTDPIGDEYILKCISNKYYVWGGFEAGFDAEPTASVFKAGNTLPHAGRAKPQTRELRSTSNTSLRPRTARQSMPYTMYNTQKKFDDRGLRLTETELEDAILRSQSPPVKKARRDQKRKRGGRTATGSTSSDDTILTQSKPNSLATSASTPVGVSDEDVCENTVFRTKFHGFERATIPVPARNCFSNEELFAAIQTKWAFKLAAEKVVFCIASFAWLNTDKNIVLQQHDSDAFQSVIAEIKSSPV